MRGPKFRGFSNETNNWHYGHGWFEIDYTEDYLLEKGIEKQAMLYTDGHPIVCEMKSMGEYTGIKDKHGKGIFEGDIVNCFVGINSLVMFNFGAFGIYTERVGFSAFCELQGYCTVIGNIYNNPELMEETE
ncbi:YopX family protein [Lysinibacillus sp. NPDC058147]|uniref:YopX family protein n=1 Tax=unclassified Lysinibacillus TaxID=2636778 RepID=UPI0036DC7D63